MELTENQTIKKNVKKCGHCSQNTSFPYEYEWTCVSCKYNVIKRKHKRCKIQRKLTKFINRLKYAEHKNICVCVVVCKI